MKKSQPSPRLLTLLRTRRRISKNALAKASGVTAQTIQRLETGVSQPQGGTWHKLLETLAGVAPFDTDEISQIAASLDITETAVLAINRRASPPSVDDRRRTARSRITAVLDAHPDRLDLIADLLESAARAFGPE